MSWNRSAWCLALIIVIGATSDVEAQGRARHEQVRVEPIRREGDSAVIGARVHYVANPGTDRLPNLRVALHRGAPPKTEGQEYRTRASDPNHASHQHFEQVAGVATRTNRAIDLMYGTNGWEGGQRVRITTAWAASEGTAPGSGWHVWGFNDNGASNVFELPAATPPAPAAPPAPAVENPVAPQPAPTAPPTTQTTVAPTTQPSAPPAAAPTQTPPQAPAPSAPAASNP